MSPVNRFSCCIVGHGKLTIECMQLLLDRGCHIEGVISSNMEVRTWSAEHGIDNIGVSDDASSFLHNKSFDYLFSIINPNRISGDILALPKIAAINYHDAPLPRYAGLYVTSWAIQNRESSYGVTWHEMSADFDAGDIYIQETFALEAEETAFSLSLKCFQKGRDTFKQLVEQLLAGETRKYAQDLSQRTVFLSTDRPRAAAVIDWSIPAITLCSLVKGLNFQSDDNPLALPKFFVDEAFYSVTDAKLVEGVDGALPGQVLASNDESLTVQCGDGALVLSGIKALTGQTSTGKVIAVGALLPVLNAEQLAALQDVYADVAKKERNWVTRLAGVEALTFENYGAVPPKIASPVSYVELGLAQDVLDAVSASFVHMQQEEIIPALFVCYLRRLQDSTELDIGVGGCMQDADPILQKLFSNRLPLRLDFDGQSSIRELIPQSCAKLAEVRAAVPFALDLPYRYQDIGSSSLPVAIDFLRPDASVPVEADTLVLEVLSGQCVRWRYQAESLAESAVKQMIGKFQVFVAAALDNLDQALDAVELVSKQEKQTLLIEWNATEKTVEESACVHDLVARQAANTPDAPAVAFKDQCISYQELESRANALANHLQQMGACPDMLIGVFSERSIEMVVALLAVHKAGAAYVPLDPAYPRDRVALMLEDSGASIVLTQSHLVSEVPGNQDKVVALDTFDYASVSSTPPTNHAKPENLAYVIYTSGSTGKPKGVMVEHRNVVNFIAGMDDTLDYQGEAGVWLAVTSISFDISVLEIFWSLSRGFKVVVQEEEQGKIGAKAHASTVARKLDVGLFYFSSDAGPSDNANRYRLLIEGAKFADQNGFSTVWTPERHFHLFGGLYPNPSVTSAAVASLTKNISIRAGSIVLPLHNPIRVAEEWSVVDNLSNGRVGFSFASGWHANDFSLKPENFENRKQIMFDNIEIVRKLWKGGTVEVVNGEGQSFEAKIYPAPVQEEPPIWITTAGNIDTFRAAGEGGFNILTNLLGQSIEDITSKIRAYREGRKAKGHAGEGNVSVMVHTFVGRSVETVKEIVREPFSNYLKTSFDLVKIAPWAFPAFKQPSKSAAQDATFDASSFTDEDMAALIDHAFDRYFETAGIFGTPESCIPLIDSLKSAGVDEVACLIDFGVNDEQVLESLPYLSKLRELANPATQAGAGANDFSIAAQIERHQVTHFQCTPSMARILTTDPEVFNALEGLKKILLGGEALPTDLAEQIASRLKGDLINVYGPTETTIWSTSCKLEAPVSEVTIGRPIANTCIYILDHTLQPAPIGVAGELLIGGKGVVRGYWKRPELSAERFIDNPLGIAKDPRVYRTGDLARYRRDGRIEFLGRLDHQVKLRGYRIELGEIESLINSNRAVKESVVVAPISDDGSQSLLAYVVPDYSAASSATNHWEVIWDEAYANEERFNTEGQTLGSEAPDSDPTLNTSGWLDSFSGHQHDHEHMKEWVEATVDRIKQCEPKRVLEVGCGTGMLLYRIAPSCESYVGIDLSHSALEMIASNAQSLDLNNIKLLQGAIDQIELADLGQFDLVIINSVVQYFPTAAYLKDILVKLSSCLTQEGRVFVGDVRHAGLKSTFDANVELLKAPATADAAELQDRYQKRQRRESELLVAPQFFSAIAEELGNSMYANIQLKRGHHANEMSVYRYDVWLEQGEASFTTQEAFKVMETALDLDTLMSALLAESTPLVFRDVPNARLTLPVQRLNAFESGAFATAADLLALKPSIAGIEPEAVYRLECDYQLELHWPRSGRPDCFDIYAVPKGAGKVYDVFEGGEKDWSVWVSEPQTQSGSHELIENLKSSIRDNLPEFMMPDDFVILGALPLTPNGKIDRKALPAPQKRERESAEEFVAPTSDIEQVIADVFSEMLNLERVGTRDNFFSLGANSLLIAQANNQLNQKLEQRVSLVAMYRYPTIASLAEFLSGEAPSSENTSKGTDRAEKRKAALGARRKRVKRR